MSEGEGRKGTEKPYCLERKKNDRCSLRRVYYHAVLYNCIISLAAYTTTHTHTHIVHHVADREKNKQREIGYS